MQHNDYAGKVNQSASKAIQESITGKGISLPAVSPVQKQPGTRPVVQMTREQAVQYLSTLRLHKSAVGQSVPEVIANDIVPDGTRYMLLRINNNGLTADDAEYLPFKSEYFEGSAEDEFIEVAVDANEYLESLNKKEQQPKVVREKLIGPEEINLKGKKITLLGTIHDDREKDRSEEIRDDIAADATVILEYPPHPKGGKSYGEVDISKVVDPVQAGLARYAALHEHDKGLTTIGGDGRKAYKEKELQSLSLRYKEEEEYQAPRPDELIDDQSVIKAGTVLVQNFLSENGDLGLVLDVAQALVSYTNTDLKHVLTNVQMRLLKLLPQLNVSHRQSIATSVTKQILIDLQQNSEGYESRAVDYKKSDKLPVLIKLTNREKINAFLDGLCNLLLFTEVLANSSQHVVVAFGNAHVKPLMELLNEIKSMED